MYYANKQSQVQKVHVCFDGCLCCHNSDSKRVDIYKTTAWIQIRADARRVIGSVLISSTNYAKSSKLLKNIQYVSYELSFFTSSFMWLDRLLDSKRSSVPRMSLHIWSHRLFSLP